MRQSRILASAGLAALLLSLVALLPARVGFSFSGLPASGLSGTIWKGAAQRLSVAGLGLGPVSWQVHPGRLLVGRLSADVKATLPDGFLNGTVALSPGGRIALSSLEAAAPLSWLTPAAGSSTGQLSARFDRLELASGRVSTALGTVKLAGFVLPLPTSGASLGAGTYSLTFTTEELAADQPLTGKLADDGGPLEIAGTVTITPPAAYEVSGTAKPRPEAPPELRNALGMLGPPTPDGAYQLSLAGSF